MLIANHILGPSYVSADTALSWHGLISERVYEIASMTTKASREFYTPAGLYCYTRLPLPYYAFGLLTIRLAEDQNAIFATPEKALCDKIITTPGLILRSVKRAYSYVLENMRMEETDVKDFNISMMKRWLNDAPKKDSLQMMIKMIEGL
jgi:hypothetical protein